MCCTVLCHSILCFIVLYCIILHYSILQSIVLCNTTFHCSILCFTVVSCSILCCIILHYSVICYNIICYSVIQYSTICYIIIWCKVGIGTSQQMTTLKWFFTQLCAKLAHICQHILTDHTCIKNFEASSHVYIITHQISHPHLPLHLPKCYDICQSTP